MATYWKQLSRHVLYSSDWLTVTLDKVELPDGKVIENFELMHFPHTAVGIVPVNEKGEILLVRAYRYINETFQWEIPGGVVEHEEAILEACKRELVEETGWEAGLFTPLITFFPHKATCNQKFHIYLAQELVQVSGEFQKVEITEVKFHSIGEVKKLIDSGEIDDGMSLVALQRYMLRNAHL